MSGATTNAGASTPETPLSFRVVEAIADAEGVAPDELDPIQNDVDLEALTTVVDSANADLSISWFVNGHLVVVDGTGDVRVE